MGGWVSENGQFEIPSCCAQTVHSTVIPWVFTAWCRAHTRAGLPMKKLTGMLCHRNEFSSSSGHCLALSRLANAVTPLWRLPYQEQLGFGFPPLLFLLIQGFAFPSFLPQPIINGYRNKSTFSVNRGPDGNPKTVGAVEMNIVCVKANHVENIPSKHKQVAQCYEEFICQSPLDPCILFHEGGHWRELVVRTSRCGHTMAIITFHPQQLGQEELAAQKALLKEFFTRGPGAVCALTSLYFQESTMTRCSHEQSPYQLLYGAPHISEELLGLRFHISPDAFFQVNTAGAELLYQAVGELCQAAGDTVLLDICCGTGTIGLSLAHRVSKVIGVEVVEKAIEDAEWNAAFNGISNCEFHSGKAEAVLPQLLASWEDARPLVAVVNPSRAGLHYRVVRAIRNCSAIRRLLYISCKPEGEAMRNFLELCCPPDPRKKLAGEPFAPVMAIPFDMFPHTVHCELVLLFTR
uniref:tRNA (uracil(54)-C(5))-methyltransferase n=1 Tax=Zonotrichia albicollis TaxID=44394 RepID=A0A8D2M5D7_ZONAL